MNKNLKKIKLKEELVQKLILSIDQGTTSSRSILFTLKGKKILFLHNKEF